MGQKIILCIQFADTAHISYYLYHIVKQFVKHYSWVVNITLLKCFRNAINSCAYMRIFC